MRTEEEVRKRLAKFKDQIDSELDTGTNDPIHQWAALKSFHAMQVALEWVLEDQEVI